MGRRISVPSSSGNSLQPKHPCSINSLTSHFSPLFIGELSSTSVIHTEKERWRKIFQSPLHRGTLFNGVAACGAGLPGAISVPSSSGNSLQLENPGESFHTGIPNFSPLFIGELSSTQAASFTQIRRSYFSPLFIGELSSTFIQFANTGNVPYIHFSPLFIGELSSTLQPTRVSHTKSCTPDFSPLFIGELSSTNNKDYGRSSFCPYFSPLFIGELSSTQFVTVTGAGDAALFQSPLHRGTLFN